MKDVNEFLKDDLFNILILIYALFIYLDILINLSAILEPVQLNRMINDIIS